MLPPGPKLPARRRPATVANVSMQARPTGLGRQHPRPFRRPLTAAEQWWHDSHHYVAALRAGVPPAPVDVHGPVLQPGEHAVLTTEASCARYCGDTRALRAAVHGVKPVERRGVLGCSWVK